MPDRTLGQVAENHAIFLAHLEADLLADHRGEYALMSSGELIGTFRDNESATQHGFDNFAVGGFSVHPIGHPPLRSGYLRVETPILASVGE